MNEHRVEPFQWFDSRRDVRHAARLLGRVPLFTMTAILSLAIGIGAAMGSIVAAALGRVLAAFLLGIAALDPVTFVGTAVLSA
jgi:hypothetical protein